MVPVRVTAMPSGSTPGSPETTYVSGRATAACAGAPEVPVSTTRLVARTRKMFMGRGFRSGRSLLHALSGRAEGWLASAHADVAAHRDGSEPHRPALRTRGAAGARGGRPAAVRGRTGTPHGLAGT